MVSVDIRVGIARYRYKKPPSVTAPKPTHLRPIDVARPNVIYSTSSECSWLPKCKDPVGSTGTGHDRYRIRFPVQNHVRCRNS